MDRYYLTTVINDGELTCYLSKKRLEPSQYEGSVLDSRCIGGLNEKHFVTIVQYHGYFDVYTSSNRLPIMSPCERSQSFGWDELVHVE